LLSDFIFCEKGMFFILFTIISFIYLGKLFLFALNKIDIFVFLL